MLTVMRRLELTLDVPESMRHPMQEFISESDDIESSRLVSGNVLDDGTARFVFYVEGDRTAYRAGIESVDDIKSYEITPDGTASFYSMVVRERREGDRQLREILEGMGAVIISPVTFTSQGTVRAVILGDPDVLRATLNDVPGDVTVRIDRFEGFCPPGSIRAANITDRQREAVEIAVDAGYYDVPREGSLADVADGLGCTSSTASNHLRKAESKVMHEVAGE